MISLLRQSVYILACFEWADKRYLLAESRDKMNRLDHIGIAVFSIEEARSFMRIYWGLRFFIKKRLKNKRRMLLFQAGSVKLELIEPLTADSPVRLFLEKKGQGLHHIAFLCNSLSEKLQALSDRKVQLIDRYPRQEQREKIAFLSPRKQTAFL